MNETNKQRASVFFNITDVSPNSEVTLKFSENLYSLEEFSKLNIDKTIFNDFRKSIIDITYITNLDKDIRPKLIDWEILSFTKDKLKIHMKFTNVLFVSSDEYPD